MDKINDQIRLYLERHPAISNCFSAGLINNSALARMMIKDLSLEKHVDAVISILRRTEVKGLLPKQAFPSCRLTTRTRLLAAYLERTDENEAKLAKRLAAITIARSGVLRTFELTNTTLIIADSQTFSRLGFQKELEVAEICIESDKQKDISSLLRVLAAEMSINSVDIAAVIGGHSEMIIIVSDKQHAKAINAIENLLSRK